MRLGVAGFGEQARDLHPEAVEGVCQHLHLGGLLPQADEDVGELVLELRGHRAGQRSLRRVRGRTKLGREVQVVAQPC